MRNPLLMGLAALCLSAGAQAQNSVTLYGLLDANITRYGAGSKTGASKDIVMNDGTANGLNGSRWGLRTTEDLGGGLKALVVLEGGLDVSTGALGQGGRIFGRQGYVALSSDAWGELRLGRQYILEDSTMWQTEPFGNALTLNPGTGITNMGNSLPFWLNAPRADNIIQYQTPVMAGVQLFAQAAPSEGGTSDRFHGLKASYTWDRLLTAISYEWNKSRTTDKNINKSLTFAINYNFGPFKLYGGLQRDRDLATGSGNGAFTGSTLLIQGKKTFTADSIDGYTLGGEIPMGAFLWGANYTWVKYAGGGEEQKLGKAALGVTYALSKRTFLYASGSTSTGDLKEYISQKTAVQAGLRTAF
jgi:general bacterial porin, GBP family